MSPRKIDSLPPPLEGACAGGAPCNSDLPREHQCPLSILAPGTPLMEIYSLGSEVAPHSENSN